jgi:hypothetical protein
MKQFDDKLAAKIRTDFAGFSPEFNSEHWNMMKEKLQKKNRKFFLILPFWAKAAVVTLFITTALMTYLYFNETKNNSEIQNINFSENKVKTKTDIESVKSKKSNFNIEKNKATKIEKVNNKNDKVYISENKIIERNKNSELLINLDTSNIVENIEEKGFAKISLEKDSVENLAYLKGKEEFKPLIFEENKTRNEVKFGAMLAGNSSSNTLNTNDERGMSLGFSTEIPINKKISLNTGIVFTTQKFSFDNSPSNNNYELDAAIPENGAIYSTNPESSKANIIAVDIPMNMQFQIMKKRKNSMYCEFGLSSFAYIKQEYSIVNYNYQTKTVFDVVTGGYTDKVVINKSNTNTSEPAFNHFDFAKVINFSLSYRYKIHNSEIAFEPYIKYPYKPITSQAVNVSFAGIVLRYIF